MSERRLYFAYGSNLDPEQMRERCPGSSPIGPALLADHRLAFTHFSKRWQGGTADLIARPDRVVWGVTYDLGDDDLERLDRFEGGYERIRLRVRSGDRPLETISYSVRHKQEHAPPADYLAKMLVWGERWGLPESYLAELRGVATL